MSSTMKIWVALIAVAIIAIGAYYYPKMSSGTTLFGSTSCGSITCLSGGLRLVSDAGGDFESDVAAVFNSTAQFLGGVTFTGAATFTATTTMNGNLNITTSDTATSSILVGCIQTTATSTATPIRLTYTLAAQNVATSTYQGGNSNGNVVWQFGMCPRR